MKPPHNVAFLDRALRALSKTNEESVQLRRVMANVIVGQFMDGAVMRGGGSLKLRYGLATTRYTMDFDAARNVTEEVFVDRFNERLAAGWGDFSGRLVKGPKPKPKRTEPKYVMQPFEVKLTYKNHPWCTVDFELSYDEVGDADAFDMVPLPKDVLAIFEKLNLPEPRPFPLMRVAHQIAQKIHGATDPDYVRVQDVIDLQLMMKRESVDRTEVRQICKRLFANRKKQSWPPKIEISDEWRVAYAGMVGDIPVLPTVDDAVAWANELIAKIDAS